MDESIKNTLLSCSTLLIKEFKDNEVKSITIDNMFSFFVKQHGKNIFKVSRLYCLILCYIVLSYQIKWYTYVTNVTFYVLRNCLNSQQHTNRHHLCYKMTYFQLNIPQDNDGKSRKCHPG